MVSRIKETIPYNKAVLAWARERCGRSYEEAAKKTGVSSDKVRDWEAGDAYPTVRQARLLAELYNRPFLEFFSDEVPEISRPILIPDFRLHRGASSPAETTSLLEIQAWAETQRLNFIDLNEILGEQTASYPPELKTSLVRAPSDFAAQLRETIDFPIERQLALKGNERDQLPKILRSRFEALGVLILKENSISNVGVRGICIYQDVVPIIVFGGEAPSAQAFTLVHEMGHVALQQSAIAGPPTKNDNSTRTERIESWCDNLAGSFLVPEHALSLFIKKPSTPLPSFDDDYLSDLAKRFSISRHAMLVRLVQLGFVSPSYYWSIMFLKLTEEEAAQKSFGIPAYYGVRYRSALGDTYTGMVMEAWSTGRITNHNAGEFMGTKNPDHLLDIRNNFGR